MGPTADLTSIVERVRRGHGLDTRDLSGATLRLSAGGPAFAMKGQRHTFENVEATVTLRPQRVRFVGPGWSEEWAAPELLSAYRRLARGRRRLRWDRHDVTAFASAALWTYVSLPHLLASQQVRARATGVLRHKDGLWDRVDLEFDDDIATHSRQQAVYIDDAGLIRRHDYVARAFGSFVTSAHFLSDYRDFDGVGIATTRHVHPRVGGRAIRRPVLVRIEIHDATFVTEQCR